MARVLDVHLPRAADSSIIEMADLVVEELEQLANKDATTCYYFLFPQEALTPVDLTKFLSADLQARDIAASARAIESGLATRAPVPTPAVAVPIMNAVMNRLRATYGPEMEMLATDHTRADRGRLCRLAIDLYRDALALPPPKNVVLLRYLLATRR